MLKCTGGVVYKGYFNDTSGSSDSNFWDRATQFEAGKWYNTITPRQDNTLVLGNTADRLGLIVDWRANTKGTEFRYVDRTGNNPAWGYSLLDLALDGKDYMWIAMEAGYVFLSMKPQRGSDMGGEMKNIGRPKDYP
ncbi:hypothetical protein BGW38_003893, partial [Lunasporangiospora selenospora]